MFLARRPSPAAIDRFLHDSRELPISYAPIGIVNGEATGRDVTEMIVTIGRGERAFERAQAALGAWTPFDIGWVELFPRGAPIAVGTVVAVLVRHLGFFSLNGCRIVYRTGAHGEARFGFAYGTLINHAESGEELFEVFIDRDTAEVKYKIRATARPQAALARLGHPIARALQARFRRDSGAAMARAIRTSATQG